jgi:hypothetical protein
VLVFLEKATLTELSLFMVGGFSMLFLKDDGKATGGNSTK